MPGTFTNSKRGREVICGAPGAARRQLGKMKIMSIRSKWPWALGILAAAAALLAYGVALQNVLLIAVLLLCPAMMFFMMGGNNMKGGARKDAPDEPPDAPHGASDKGSKEG